MGNDAPVFVLADLYNF